MPIDELTPDRLYRSCSGEAMEFETTADLEPVEDMVGQPRAVAAVRFGTDSAARSARRARSSGRRPTEEAAGRRTRPASANPLVGARWVRRPAAQKDATAGDD